MAAITNNQTNVQKNYEQPSDWQGRNLVVIDTAYHAKKTVKAGMGPPNFDGMFRALFTIAILFAAAVAALSVVLAGGTWAAGLITLGVVSSVAILLNIGLSASASRL